jgi:hypothetical protein
MVNRGNALFKLKRVAEAVEAFAGAAAAAPGHLGILNNYGQALDEAGDGRRRLPVSIPRLRAIRPM